MRRSPFNRSMSSALICALLAILAAAVSAQPSAKAVEAAIPKITAAAPDKAAAKPAKARKLLVFSVTRGFRHRSIPVARKALEILGARTGAWETVVSDDLANFDEERLATFDAVCFVNTTGPVFASDDVVERMKQLRVNRAKLARFEAILDQAGTKPHDQTRARLARALGRKDVGEGPLTAGEIAELKKIADEARSVAELAQKVINDLESGARDEERRRRDNLLRFIRDGGGFVGIHSATDVYHEWPPYTEMIGGRFACHPWNANCKVSICNREPAHPVNAALPRGRFEIKDEIYQVRDYRRERVRVLLGLDTLDGRERLTGIRGTRHDDDYAVTWLRRYGKGRVFYCSLGHNEHVYWDPRVLRHYLAGIQFALGDLEADATPLATRDLLVSDPNDYDVDPFMGRYHGQLMLDAGPNPRKRTDAVAFVIARGEGRYEIVLVDDRGRRATVTASADETGLVVAAPSSGRLERRVLRMKQGNDTFEGRLLERRSPTLGAPPPPGALVLLPFAAKQDAAPPSLQAWTNEKWKALADGSMRVTKGNNTTRRAFRDLTLHVEFRIPYEPKKRKQGRGNSGVYLANNYEVQVLDSFGLDAKPNDCGAIYNIAKPRENACLPPLRWQTYDIDFTAARFAADGTTLTAQPRITVRHNGRLIHENQEISRPTGGGGNQKQHVKGGPLHLQDHTNPLQYRNIWVVERGEER